MIKAASLLIAGGIVGAGAMYFFIDGDESNTNGQRSRSLLQGLADVVPGRRQMPEIVTTSESLTVYLSVAAENDPSALESALEMAASDVWSPARDLQIDALISRMSELDPARTATLTQALGLELNFVADAFLSWAEIDSNAALVGLGGIENTIMKHQIALALLDVFGDDGAGFNRVSSGLPQSERESLQIEWLGRRAEFDPVGAFREAQSIYDTDVQRRALARVASAWAEQDPVSALAQANTLPAALQTSFRVALFTEWARLDGAGYFAWIQSVASPPQEAVVGLQYLALSDPERMFDLVDGMPGDSGQTMRMAALQSLAEINPQAAMARVSALPSGSDKDMMLMVTGMALARSDPDAALDWARNLSPPSPNAVRQVAMAVAESNPERALEFIDNPPDGIDPQLISSLLVSVVSRDPDQAEVLANQLIARDTIQVRNALRNLIGNWMQQDPEGALNWILVHDDQVNAGVLGSAAQSMARSDAAAAAAYTDRIPAEYRSAWITQVAAPYALNDPAAALAWVAQFQGQDFYAGALRGVITGSAQTDPRRAAELLSQANDEVQLGAAPQVAQLWAQKDPRAAARWAVDLADDRIRARAVEPAVSVWAVNDLSAAKSWTLDLDRGETRDQALNAVVTRAGSSGDFDRSLLNAYSSDSASQDALRRVIPLMARNNPDEAADLLDLVTSANTRVQIEEQIEQLNARR